MKKFFVGIGVFALILGFSVAPMAHASGEKFVFEQLFKSGSNIGTAFFGIDSSGDTISGGNINFPAGGAVADETALKNLAVNAIVDWANTSSEENGGGFSGITANDVFTIKPITQYWHNGTQQLSAKHITFTGTTTSGSVVFYLTDDGTVNGTALCSSAPKSVSVTSNNSTANVATSYAVTNSEKTLTITAKIPNAISLLGVDVISASALGNAVNGTEINVSVDCN